MKKSELRAMIREVLEEELDKADSQLTEATPKRLLQKMKLEALRSQLINLQ